MHREIYQFIFNKLSLRLIMLAVSVVLLVLSYYIKHEISVVAARYSSDYDKINAETDKMHQLADRVEESIELWNSTLSKVYDQRNGVDVNLAKQKVYDLRKTYGLKDLSVHITDPADNKTFASLKYVSLESSILKMTFKAKSDVDVVGFISDFKHAMPGIISDLYMEMRLDATSHLVDVKLILLWQNFLDKKND